MARSPLALAAAVTLVALPGAAAAQVVWEPSIGVDYSRGAYGATEDTEVTYVPLSLRATTPRWRFDMAVPWLRVRGPQGSVAGGVVIPGTGPVVENDGLGDVTLSATYQLTAPGSAGTAFEIGGGVKLPTADETLGTGKTDYNVQLGVRHPVSDRLMLVGSLGYQWLGDPVAYELTDGPTASLGFNYAAQPRTNVGVIANYRSAYFAGFDDQIMVSPYVRLDSESGWALTAYGTAGFTDASPDFGLGLMVGRVF